MLPPTSGSETTQTPDELAQLACGPDLHKCALARLIDHPDQSRNLVLADFIRRFAENPRVIGLPLRAMSFLYAAPQLCVVHSITANLFFQPLQAAKQCTRSWKSGAIPMHAIYQCYYWTRLICCVTQTTTVGDLRKRQYVAGQWTMASTGSQDVMSALTRTGLYRSRRLANMSLHCAARRYQTPRA